MSVPSPRGRRTSPVAIVALTLGLGVFACGDVTQFETSTGAEAPETLASTIGSFPPFLMLVEGAKDGTAFWGVRRVRSVRGNEILETRQIVGADGLGNFAIELLEVISLTSDFEPNAFQIVFENSLRFQWQVRDFRIRSLDRAAQNYSINVLPQSQTVVGIACARVEFRRYAPIGGRPGHYEADIDPRTGFVLAWREFDLSGQTIVESMYERFRYDGDVSNLNLRGRTFAAQSLDLAAPLDVQAGFDVNYPDTIPVGFEVVSGEVMDVPNSFGTSGNLTINSGPWVRFVVTDGIETVTFLHNDLQAPTMQVTSEIKVLRFGAWNIGLGDINGTGIVIAGRMAFDEMLQIVLSAF